MNVKKKPNPVDIHVGARIRMRRLMLGLSQEKLADGLGLTFQQVQKYEKGSNRVGASRLQQIANVLQVQPTFFFEGLASTDGGFSEEQPLYINQFVSSSDGLALAKAFMSIKSPAARRSIVKLVEEMGDAKDD